MSQINNAPSAHKTTILSAISSFVGMMAAIPVALAIFSGGQPANAMQTQSTQDDSYAKYAKAYTDGYMASTASVTQPVSCEEPQQSETSESAAPKATATSYTAKKMPAMHHKMMSHKEWTKIVKNSYNKYVTNTYNKTKVYTKNINSNNTIGSNNTSNSSVVVKDSNGAVVSNNVATDGKNYSNTDVDNVASNNTVTVNDSFNQDSHDKTVTVQDSGNTTKNTTIVNDSFNKKTDVDVNVNSGNKIDNSQTYVKHDELHL